MKLELEFDAAGQLVGVRQDEKSIALAGGQRARLPDAMAMLDRMLITAAEGNCYLPKEQRERWRQLRLEVNTLFFAMFGKPIQGPERDGCAEVRLQR